MAYLSFSRYSAVLLGLILAVASVALSPPARGEPGDFTIDGFGALGAAHQYQRR